EGHEGFGGLDLYATQVAQHTLTPSVNLGAQVNSDSDDYAIQLSPENKMGLVVSNRGTNKTISQYTVAYGPTGESDSYLNLAQREAQMQIAMKDAQAHDYVETNFEEE